MASFPTKLQQELLVFGYTRNFEKGALRIPICIKELCLKAYTAYIKVHAKHNLPGAPPITLGIVRIHGIDFEAQYIRWRHSAGIVITVSSPTSYIQSNHYNWYFNAYCPQLNSFNYHGWRCITQRRFYLYWYGLASIPGDFEIICQFHVKGISTAKPMMNITEITWNMTKVAKHTRRDVELVETEIPAYPEKILHGPASKGGHWFVSYTPPDKGSYRGQGLLAVHLLEMPALLKTIKADVRIQVYYGGKKKIDCVKRCYWKDEGTKEIAAGMRCDRSTRIVATIMIVDIKSKRGTIFYEDWSVYGVMGESANL